MKTIIPLKSSVAIINNKFENNEICVILKHFNELNMSNLKIDFKEVGFDFETVKDSVFFQSYLVLELKKKYLDWLIKNDLYKFFSYRSGLFFLSHLFNFKDFYSFLFIFLFLLRKNNFFLSFLINKNLIFLNSKQCSSILMPFINLLEKKFFLYFKSAEFNLFFYKKINFILKKNYSFFCVWFYFFSILRYFLYYFIFKFYIYIKFQSKLFFQCQRCFNQ